MWIIAGENLAVDAIAFAKESDLPCVANTLGDLVIALAPAPHCDAVWHAVLPADLGQRLALDELLANAIDDLRPVLSL